MQDFSQLRTSSETSWIYSSTHFGHVNEIKTLLNIYLGIIEQNDRLPCAFLKTKVKTGFCCPGG